MRQSSCGTCMLVTATIFGPIVLAILAVSFATDYWIEYKVDRPLLTAGTAVDSSQARVTHDRNRGLFRECYTGQDPIFLDTAAHVVDGNCFFVSYEIPDEVSGANWSGDFLARIHLMRCWLAFFILALVAFLTAYIFGLVLCCWRASRWAYIAGLCAYISAFATAASIAFFHGAEYLERNKIDDAHPDLGYFYLQWGSDLQNATDRNYHYSYVLGWVGMVLAALTATFYSVAGCYIGAERYEDDKRRMRGYNERNYPLALEPPVDPHYGYKQGPYLYNMDTREPMPAITYGPEQMPAHWQWR